MAIKIVMGIKSGKCFQKELSQEESESLYTKVLGEEINGELIGFPGASFKITGGSDSGGFPMRADLLGQVKKKILVTKGIGFRGKLKGKRFGGLRIKKTMAGNTIFDKTHQINLKVLKGEKIVEDSFKVSKEEEK